MRIRPIFLAFPLLLSATAASAATPAPAAKPACVALEDGWIRLPPAPQAMMLAGFGRIANHCPDAQAVVAVRSPRFGDVSLHESRQVDGVNRMRELDRLPVAAGGEALLQPGGLHLMLMQPTGAALAEGEKVPLVLVLADGREVAGELQVRTAAAEPAHSH